MSTPQRTSARSAEGLREAPERSALDQAQTQDHGGLLGHVNCLLDGWWAVREQSVEQESRQSVSGRPRRHRQDQRITCGDDTSRLAGLEGLDEDALPDGLPRPSERAVRFVARVGRRRLEGLLGRNRLSIRKR